VSLAVCREMCAKDVCKSARARPNTGGAVCIVSRVTWGVQKWASSSFPCATVPCAKFVRMCNVSLKDVLPAGCSAVCCSKLKILRIQQ
jgi:hypothetical protein